jgi:hypothetical protein
MNYGEKQEKYKSAVNPRSPFGLNPEHYAETKEVVVTRSKVCGHEVSSPQAVPRKLYDKTRDELRAKPCPECFEKGLAVENPELLDAVKSSPENPGGETRAEGKAHNFKKLYGDKPRSERRERR